MSNTVTQYPIMKPTFLTEEVDAQDTRATVVIEPLEQGYGHTLGNALRRVLLTSLPGHAITQVRIEGADHQFTTIDGLTEDVMQLILNIKQVRLRSQSEDEGVLRLDVTGPMEITAGDIECSAGYEVVNPDQYLGTLADGEDLQIEMSAGPGVGYVVADETQSKTIGEIMVDALYSPIIKVSYDVEATRVGRRTDYDKLNLHIETDGTVSPLEAVEHAARILSRQFTQIFEPVIPEVEEPEEELSPEEAEVLRLTVEELDLPTRIANALRKGGFKTVADLEGVSKETISKVKNLGEKSVEVIEEALERKGVELGE